MVIMTLEIGSGSILLAVPMRLFLAASLVTMAASCAAVPEEAPKMREAANGAYATSELEEPVAYIAFDEESFRALFARHVGQDVLPAVDFPRESAVLLMGGRRSTGGWSVTPHAVSASGDVLIVDAVVSGPPRGGIVSQAITSPWAVIAVSPVSFKKVQWQP
jgi:hypothetical protein